VPGDLEGITTSLTTVLDRISALPLDQLVRDLDATLQSYQPVADMPELRQSIHALAAAESLMRNVPTTQAGPLLASLRKASDAAQGAIVHADATLASVNSGHGNDSRYVAT
jgi:hypothetical protein